MLTQRPATAEYAPFFADYVALVTEHEVLGVLESQPAELAKYASGVSQEKETYSYQEGKWSLRQVFGHLSDAERVFGHRAFCIGRGEQAALPSFDENEYMVLSDAAKRPLLDLVNEFEAVRVANLTYLRLLDDASWLRTGTAGGNSVSVRALAFIMAGHVRHHLGILRTRYGVHPVS